VSRKSSWKWLNQRRLDQERVNIDIPDTSWERDHLLCTPRDLKMSREQLEIFQELMFAMSTDLTSSNLPQVVILVDSSSTPKMHSKSSIPFSEPTIRNPSERLDTLFQELKWPVLILPESSTLTKFKLNLEISDTPLESTTRPERTHWPTKPSWTDWTHTPRPRLPLSRSSRSRDTKRELIELRLKDPRPERQERYSETRDSKDLRVTSRRLSPMPTRFSKTKKLLVTMHQEKHHQRMKKNLTNDQNESADEPESI